MREPVNDYEGSTRLRENRAYVKYYFDEYIDRIVTKYIVLPDAQTERDRLLRLLKKGDLIRYSGHIAIMHSDRWGDESITGYPNIDYDVIHAFSSITGDYHNEFARKVMITGDDIRLAPLNVIPIGLGRIKLWN